MDISGVSSSAISMIASTGTQTGVATQKKVMEMQEQTATKLIEAIQQTPQKPTASSTIGGNIDVKA
ncbi:MAG: putative motility protein [Candidatus Thiodiazotropha sp. LLP2]